jgi:hypothetical protein
VLPGKPSFTRVDMVGGTVQVAGKSDADETPHLVHVTLLQDVDGQEEPHSAETTLELPASDWEANFKSDGFRRGPVVVIGHEISVKPHFSAHTWVEYMDIK